MIDIVIGPNLVSLGTFLLSWHGFFSFVAVASAVFLVGRWAPMKGIDPDDIYSIAIWGIIGFTPPLEFPDRDSINSVSCCKSFRYAASVFGDTPRSTVI